MIRESKDLRALYSAWPTSITGSRVRMKSEHLKQRMATDDAFGAALRALFPDVGGSYTLGLALNVLKGHIIGGVRLVSAASNGKPAVWTLETVPPDELAALIDDMTRPLSPRDTP